MDDLIKELKELKAQLKADGYKEWCYASLTVDKTIKAISTVQSTIAQPLPDMKIEEAEILSMQCDYACFAIEDDNNKINTADASAFFLEGYLEAKRRLDGISKEEKQANFPIVNQRNILLAFARKMQNIGFNEMDDIEKVVDIYLEDN